MISRENDTKSPCQQRRGKTLGQDKKNFRNISQQRYLSFLFVSFNWILHFLFYCFVSGLLL